jgi:stearoyl-CoA desaturase (delta-9 desaturase)
VVRGAHRLHAILMLIVPAIGAVFTCVDAVQHGVTRLDLALFTVFYVITALGLGLGFHRLFSHWSFMPPPWMQFLFAVAGSMAGQGPMIYWVANHRRHHRYSDHSGDPHSPHADGPKELKGLSGFIHAHMGWTLDHELTSTLVYTPDLLKLPVLRAANRLYLLWVLLGVLIPAAIGGIATRSWYGAYSGLLWGGFFRLFIGYHLTFAVNSASHMFGRRDYETGDQSRNNMWLLIPTLGEAWHNTHHAFPAAAILATEWWQFDACGYLVMVLERLGLVSDVRRITKQMVARKRRKI